MDVNRFDSVARVLAQRQTRRSALASLVLGALGAHNIQSAEAKPRGVTVCHRGKARRVKASSLDAHLRHGDTLVTPNLATDPSNCGRCGNVCPGGICRNGVCEAPEVRSWVTTIASDCRRATGGWPVDPSSVVTIGVSGFILLGDDTSVSYDANGQQYANGQAIGTIANHCAMPTGATNVCGQVVGWVRPPGCAPGGTLVCAGDPNADLGAVFVVGTGGVFTGMPVGELFLFVNDVSCVYNGTEFTAAVTFE